MSKLIDITGQRFGRLLVVERAESLPRGAAWMCKCDCGAYIKVAASKLRNAHTRSCGCLVTDTIGSLNKTYGMSKSRLHYIWGNMKSRCYNPNNAHYVDYGGRGITICDVWRNDFTAFVDWAYGSGYAADLSIDRVNNDGNYEPGNCRWATAKEQANNRRSSKLHLFRGEEKSISEWGRIYGQNAHTVLYRIRHGWSLEDALTRQSRSRPAEAK